MLRHHTDPDAVQVLCDDAKRSIPCAGSGVCRSGTTLEGLVHSSDGTGDARPRAGRQIESWLRAQCQNVTDSDLCEILRTARTELSGGRPVLTIDLSIWFGESSP